MSSAAQIAANQANAKLSTGPKTEAGKAVSSQNSRKLGLAGATFCVLSVDDQENFDSYKQELTDYYQPANVIERTLLLKMAQHYWCSQRAFLAQSCCFGENMETINHPHAQRQLALQIRYQSTHDRAFHKCRKELENTQAERKAAPLKQETAVLRVEILKQKHERTTKPQVRIAKTAPAMQTAPAVAAAAVPFAA